MNVVTVALLFSLSSAHALGGHHDNMHHQHGEGPVVDLHKGDHCSDISYYTEVEWKPMPCNCCETLIEKKCWDTTVKECLNVTDMVCSTVAWAECKMEMHQTKGTKCVYPTYEYDVKECEIYTDWVPHEKEIPVCKNVTKLNCVTNWKDLPDGTKKWDGNERCTNVTWKQCTLEPITVQFEVNRTRCYDTTKIPYMGCKNQTTSEMISSLKCEVKKSANCVPKIKESCVDVKYQECKEVPTLNCTDKIKPKPSQMKVHQKKCLLPPKP